MADVAEVVRLWEDVVSRWRAAAMLPEPIGRWRASYEGAVDRDALPELYLGSWRQGRAAMLDMHPGQTLGDFQYRGRVFDRDIQRLGSYEAWAADWPYVNRPWTDRYPPVRHVTARRRFLQDWFDDPGFPYGAMLGVELYPWHVATATAPMRPDPGIIREFILAPLASADLRVAFAFGARWFEMLTDHLGLEVVQLLGAGGMNYKSRVESRAVLVCEGPSGLPIIAEKHMGSIAPPARDEALLLRDTLQDLKLLKR